MKKTPTKKTLAKVTPDLDDQLTQSGHILKRGKARNRVESPVPVKQNMPKLLIMAIVSLLLLIGLVVYLNQLKNQANSDHGAPSIALTNSDNNRADTSTDSGTAFVHKEDVGDAADPAATLDNSVKQDILTAPIPPSDALIKEEIQRMDDEHARLQEQEALLNEQMAMVDDIHQKKEAQIALLEERVALLEAASQ